MKITMRLQKSIIQSINLTIVHVIALLLLAALSPGLQIQSLAGAVGFALVYLFAQGAYWWLFINFFSWLPVWLYPLLTFLLAGGLLFLLGNLVPGILIADFRTGVAITMTLTSVGSVLGGLLSLDMDEKFYNHVTRKLVARRGNVMKTDTPGFLFLEIDGLSEKLFRQALANGHMPTLHAWHVSGSHKIMGWETDFTAQTGAMQSGILLGNNENIPAYRWWDRAKRQLVLVGDPRHAAAIEARLSSGQGLLSAGGASRSNMFSGDATESLFTFGTLLDRRRGAGPGFYLYLVSPFIIARLITRSILEVLREWVQAIQQRLRGDKYITSARTPLYAIFRAIMGPLLQDLTTYIVISDVLRGLPAIYASYPAYDDLAHFAGMETPEAFRSLTDIDRYFSRIARALQDAPRPYHVVVLSDHGQSTGPTFQAAYGLSLEKLVEGSVDECSQVYAALNTNEAWDRINAFLNESIHANTRTSRVLSTMLSSKTKGGLLAFGPDRHANKAREEAMKIQSARLIVLASGPAGFINFKESPQRMTYEQIQDCYPNLILSLIQHPGIGFVLVRSREHGDIVLGKGGIYFLDTDTAEGKNPLEAYGSNAAAHLKRESSFANCADIVVNTAYDPSTGELCGFENQVSHHGGLGGLQNFPFIFYPAGLLTGGEPVVGAMDVHRVLRGWRDAAQAEAASQTRPATS